MPTLIYTPAIRAHIMPGTKDARPIDISEDLINWQVILRENAPHTFTFKLQNQSRKYDGTFAPMDRISVAMKRINWLQVFTGYLNTAPIFQAWPGTLDLTATCTLKLPMYHYWDPNAIEAYFLVNRAMTHTPTGEEITGRDDGQDGLTNIVIQSMTKVLGWPKEHIHLGRIPQNWADFARKVGGQILKDTAIYEALGQLAVINGNVAGTTGAGANLPGGTYGGYTMNVQQAKWASQIYNEIQGPLKLASRTDIKVMTMMCVITESNFRMYANGNNPASLKLPHDAIGYDHGSVGLFQQQVGGATNSTADWGTTEELMDAATSTKKFVTPLVKYVDAQIGGGVPQASDESKYGEYVQHVQGSAPNAYHKVLTQAKGIVAALDKVSKTTPAATPSPNGINPGLPFGTDPALDFGGTNTAQSTGVMVARMAANLIHVHADSKKYIIYHLGNDDPDTTDINAVTKLDCSSLVDWVYFAANGHKTHLAKGGGRSNVASIHAQVRGTKREIPVELAYYIRGAALIATDHHIGISLGNGKDHVAAHDVYTDTSKDVDISPVGNQFDTGALLPGVDYSGSATTQPAADKLKKIMNYPKVTIAPDDPSLKIDAPGDSSLGTVGTETNSGSGFSAANLVNGMYYAGENYSIYGSALGGPVQLANDEPFLPWLHNVVLSSMRSYCSAPNGDFIAWFPDYFGLWGTAAIMNIETIELQNFAVYWDDQSIVTHQFVIGSSAIMAFNPETGGVDFGAAATGDLIALAMGNDGVATMDYPEIFEAIYHEGRGLDSGAIDAYLQRFGARPNLDRIPVIRKGNREFFMALYLFMQHWAGQFTATIPITFMPELFPGMLVRIPEYGFQAYVKQVTHQAGYGQGGAFTTSIQISSPSTYGNGVQKDALAWLPRGGEL